MKNTVRRDGAIIVSIFAALFAIYLSTAAPSVFYGDSAELQTVPYTGGIPHPSGYPSFVLLGALFGKLPGGDPARRITAMTAFFGAASVSLLYAVLRKLRLPASAALVAAAAYGLSYTFWWNAMRAEVYTLAVCFFLAASWLTLRALERPIPLRAAGAGAALGLTLTGHLAFAPPVLVLLAVLVFKRPAPRAPRSRYIFMLLAAMLIGLAPYLYLVRADRSTSPMNYLNHTVEPASGQFGLTEDGFDDPWERIPWLVSGRQYEPAERLPNKGTVLWQSVRVLVIEFLYHFGPIAFPLFLAGIYAAVKKVKRYGWGVLAVMAVSALFAIVLRPGLMLQTFLMPVTLGIAAMLGFGVWLTVEGIAGRAKRPGASRVALMIAFAFALILLPHIVRWNVERSASFPQTLKLQDRERSGTESSLFPTLRGFREPRALGERLLEVIPRNALVTGSWNEIMVLCYLHFVEGMRPDISIDPYHSEHIVRLERWQQSHDPAAYPIVLLHPVTGLTDGFRGIDSVAVDGFGTIYILRDTIGGRY